MSNKDLDATASITPFIWKIDDDFFTLFTDHMILDVCNIILAHKEEYPASTFRSLPFHNIWNPKSKLNIHNIFHVSF